MKMKGKSTMTWLMIALWAGKSLPKSLCTYFWTSVFTLIFAIVYAPALLIVRLVPTLNDYVIEDRRLALDGENNFGSAPGVLIYSMFYALLALFVIAGHSFTEGVLNFDLLWGNIWHGIIALSVGLGITAVICGTVWLTVWLLMKLFTGGKVAIHEIGDTTAGKYIAAKKSKMCPVIEYED